jgi:hypothetical protein
MPIALRPVAIRVVGSVRSAARMALCALLAASCAGSGGMDSGGADPPADAMPMDPMRNLSDDGIFYVESGDAAHPRVRYLDGQVSLNQSCAIRLENKLNRKIPPVYVNGQPIGFC